MATITDRHSKSNGQGQGSKWIRRERRLGIYLRDGLSCAYCGEGVEDGALLTLDHLTPHVDGGGNENENIVTCCHRCNSARGARSWVVFAETVAAYLNHGIEPIQIISHIETTRRRPVDVAAAKTLIAARGSYAAALKN